MASDSSVQRSAVEDDRALRRARLAQFLRYMLPVAIGFTVVYFVASAWFHSLALLLAGINVVGYIGALLLARHYLRAERVEAAAEIVAFGLFVMCIIGAPIMPWLRAALVLIPVAGVALVLSDLEGARLRRLMILGFLAEAVIVSAATWMPPWLPPPPPAMRSAIVVAAATIAVALIFLLLFQDANRLRRSIATADFHALKLRAVVERAPIVIFALDDTAHFTLSEGYGLAMFGLRPGEIVGRSAYTLYAELEWLHGAIERALRGEETSAVGVFGERNFEVHLRPLEGGGAIGIAMDVTARERAEKGLRLISDASRVLGEPSEDLCAVLDRVARVAVEQFATECTIALVDDSGALNPTAAARRHPTDAEPRSTISAALLARDGHPLGVLTVSSSERSLGQEDTLLAEDLAGRAAAAIEARGLYDAAQQAIRVRDEFLSIASHELKTPLTPLRLQTAALERAAERGDVPRMRSKAEGLQKHVTRLTALVDELLDVGRLRAGRISLNPQDADLAEIVREVIARLEPELERAGCPVVTDVSGDTRGCWDASRLDQVVTNLMTNAAKYAPGKPIAVTLHADGDSVLVTVKDHGIGIAKADQQRIFQRFERAVSDRNYGGLGLGLFIVHELVTAHDGTVAVKSVPGEGAVFEVRLPRARRVSRAS